MMASSVSARISGPQSGRVAVTSGMMYVSTSRCRNAMDSACAAADTMIDRTTMTRRTGYWEM